MLSNWTTSRLVITGLLFCLALVLQASGQVKGKFEKYKQAQTEFYNGNSQKAIDLAKVEVEKAREVKDKLVASQGLVIIANSQISMRKYRDAEQTLNEALLEVPENSSGNNQKAIINIHFARLFRSQYKFTEALNYSEKAVKLAPNNRLIKGGHFLNIGRILFASGFDISAIIWLEKADKLLDLEVINSAKLNVYKYLALAWWSKLNYPKALEYANKWVSSSEETQYKYSHRQALYQLGSILNAANQKQNSQVILEKGLDLSINQNNYFQTCDYLSYLLFNSLDEKDTSEASEYLEKLKKADRNKIFEFEILLGEAVLSALEGQSKISEEIFSKLEKIDKPSEFIVPHWKIVIAKHNKNWEKMLKFNQELLELTLKDNYRQDLPEIYLNFAKVYFIQKQLPKSLENIEKSLSLIEEIRKSENKNLSLSLFETYHKAYRLLVQIKSENLKESFELTDFLKARFLKDRINNSVFKDNMKIGPVIREQLEELSLKFIEDQSVAEEIEKYEKIVTNSIPDLELNKPDLSKLNDLADLTDTAIVSYFFTLDKQLIAYVWEKNQPLKIINLPVSESEIEADAKTTHQKMKNLIFFKRDGKELYDKLLKPLSLKAKHLIIIPDKSLWKIPFQALSPDGKNYLIEEKLISYSPSISILLDQFKKPKPNRQSFQAFANSTFENKSLQYVNSEAIGVAYIYKTRPILNATIADFEKLSGKSDIIHFSMHAQVANEQPLESFLAFRKNGKNDGHLTVEEILDIKLKQGSLAFLASCDTTNVLNGEGLVSLSWAMMASGATTVVSAQWEANDKSTEVFTKIFYENYKKGSSSAEALQKASLELIQNKSNNMHEPYFWAEFTLNGDFR